MPEGDTVRHQATVLQRALAGRVVTGSDFRLPGLATVDLTGWTIAESTSRGKHLLLRLTAPTTAARPVTAGADTTANADATGGAAARPRTSLTLHSHLRMDGSWRVYRAAERWRGGPGHTIRVVLTAGDVTVVGYHLHDVALVPTAEEDALVGHLGPDLLGPDWDADAAAANLAAQPGRAIGEALLDQRNLAGIGNVYATEMLFLRGVEPWRPVGEVKDLRALVDLGHRLLSANVARPGHVTTGDTRPGRENWVYGRAGRPCRRCGTPIEKGEQGPAGQERLRYWCPSCQK
jgi:endonuclease VIII